MMLARFYVYAYLREDGSPYYIGKGTGNRAWRTWRNVKPPTDPTRIIIVCDSLFEDEAFTMEKYGIALFGRKDKGTGILRNLTDGGEGTGGFIQSDIHKEKIRKAMIGVSKSPTHCANIGKSKMGNAYGVGNRGRSKGGTVTYLPTKQTWNVTNVLTFCREHGLDSGHLGKVANGKREHHKHYRLTWANEVH